MQSLYLSELKECDLLGIFFAFLTRSSDCIYWI